MSESKKNEDNEAVSHEVIEENQHTDGLLTKHDHTGPSHHVLDSIGAGGDHASASESHLTEDMLQSQAQTLIDEVNRKRQRDTESIEDYKNCQVQQVEKFCSQIETHMFETYKVQNRVVDEKIQELFATLERIARLRAELDTFRGALQNLYKEIMA